jgi:ubiquinone/menaquinone biosynthesis C-methylase UbiE
VDVTRTREAFDRHALTYDERFSSLAAAQAIRRQVWCIADALFSPGSRLLDLGCGTGDDAIHFAERGIQVTSIDISPGMIAQLLLKAEAAGVQGRIVAHIADLETFQPETEFNGLFSNFGALNCVPQVSGLCDRPWFW